MTERTGDTMSLIECMHVLDGRTFTLKQQQGTSAYQSYIEALIEFRKAKRVNSSPCMFPVSGLQQKAFICSLSQSPIRIKGSQCDWELYQAEPVPWPVTSLFPLPIV